MAEYAQVTFSADASLTTIATLKNANGEGSIRGIIEVGGSSFGSGTMTFFLSLDGGTTKNAWDDLSGVAYSITANKTIPFDFEVKLKDNDTGIILYATVASSSSPTITVKVYDNT